LQDLYEDTLNTAPASKRKAEANPCNAPAKKRSAINLHSVFNTTLELTPSERTTQTSSLNSLP
jgi:hypothetical protein